MAKPQLAASVANRRKETSRPRAERQPARTRAKR